MLTFIQWRHGNFDNILNIFNSKHLQFNITQTYLQFFLEFLYNN